jgi:hypothetical protein
MAMGIFFTTVMSYCSSSGVQRPPGHVVGVGLIVAKLGCDAQSAATAAPSSTGHFFQPA